ncbi:MAG: hypothetical protein ACRDO9_07395 [Gaiellales bacterium]
MTRWGWERLAALSGLAAVALWVIGVVLEEASGLPGEDPNEILSWFQDESNTILSGAFILMLGSLFFLIFVRALRLRLVRAESESAFLTAIAFGAGLVVVAMTLLIRRPGADGHGRRVLRRRRAGSGPALGRHRAGDPPLRRSAALGRVDQLRVRALAPDPADRLGGTAGGRSALDDHRRGAALDAVGGRVGCGPRARGSI